MSVLVVTGVVYYNPKGYIMVRSDIIDISWSDRKLQKSCSSDKDGKRTFGADQWKVLKRRIVSLEVAPTLADMQSVPGRFHELSADRAGQFSLDLRGSYRLIFEPDHEPVPLVDAGGIDRTLVTKIVITEVADYHGR